MNKNRLMQNLKNARKKAGLTQTELSILTGTGKYQNIAQWELGYRTPKIESIEKIAKACGVSPFDLLDGVFCD